jgi:hypothetical protein
MMQNGNPDANQFQSSVTIAQRTKQIMFSSAKTIFLFLQQKLKQKKSFLIPEEEQMQARFFQNGPSLRECRPNKPQFRGL